MSIQSRIWNLQNRRLPLGAIAQMLRLPDEAVKSLLKWGQCEVPHDHAIKRCELLHPLLTEFHCLSLEHMHKSWDRISPTKSCLRDAVCADVLDVERIRSEVFFLAPHVLSSMAVQQTEGRTA